MVPYYVRIREYRRHFLLSHFPLSFNSIFRFSCVEATTMATQGSAVVYHEQSRPWFLPLLGFLPFLLPFFWTYEVTVTNDNITFGYSTYLTRENVERRDILSADSIANLKGLSEWGGWGIRKNLRWETGYIARDGPAVKLTVVVQGGKRKNIVFSCREAEKVCRTLNNAQD